jgi:hypothetical protein
MYAVEKIFPTPTLLTSHCHSIELAMFYSYTTLRREKEQLYWHSMAASTAVKAKPGLSNLS